MRNYFAALWAALLNRPIASGLVLRDTLELGPMKGGVVTGCRFDGVMSHGIRVSP